jgi:hypothetical protein
LIHVTNLRELFGFLFHAQRGLHSRISNREMQTAERQRLTDPFLSLIEKLKHSLQHSASFTAVTFPNAGRFWSGKGGQSSLFEQKRQRRLRIPGGL